MPIPTVRILISGGVAHIEGVVGNLCVVVVDEDSEAFEIYLPAEMKQITIDQATETPEWDDGEESEDEE